MVQSGMADRPKLSIKPLAPERDPYRARVRGATAPRPAPKPREAAPDAPPRGDQRPDPRGPQRQQPPQRPSAPPAAMLPRPAPRKNTGRDEPHADGLRVAKLMTDRGLSSRREAESTNSFGRGIIQTVQRLSLLRLIAESNNFRH